MAIFSEIEERVLEALEQDKRTAKYSIEAVNQGGLVTLRGEVYNEQDRKAAVEIASRQKDVVKVIDELEISKPNREPKLKINQEIINRASNE